MRITTSYLTIFLLIISSCSKDDVYYTLTVSSVDGGSVDTATGVYEEGTKVTITATPDEGYEFASWSNGLEEQTITITITEDIELTAYFLGLVVSETFENLYAPQVGGVDPRTGAFTPISGEFTKFNFSTGQVTTSETDWDVAFRGTSIIINGGVSLGTIDEPARTGNAAVYIAAGTMSSVTEVNLQELSQDSAGGYAIESGGGNGWYTYQGPPVNLITPTPGKILVFRTNDGKYAKMEILSYYKDAPENPDAYTSESRYYTFNYQYQPNEGITSF